MKSHDVIPRAWLQTMISRGRDKTVAEQFFERVCVAVDFDKLWARLSADCSQSTLPEELWWFESSAKSYRGLALIRHNCIVWYQLIR